MALKHSISFKAREGGKARFSFFFLIICTQKCCFTFDEKKQKVFALPRGFLLFLPDATLSVKEKVPAEKEDLVPFIKCSCSRQVDMKLASRE